ncbi:MAG: response regulator transcription factor [Deltaproteobacteria bacterium]|nr:response regulator transcription factor [Deltaproteobacteria bacterium]
MELGGYRFLLVEDEPVVARALAGFFKHYGEVTTAGSVGEAARYLGTGAMFAGLIVDWKLPDGDGLDVIRAAREQDPRLPILMMTGHLDADCINEVHALRAEYVAKPASKRNLRDFANRATGQIDESDIDAVVQALRHRHGLARAEERILRLTLGGTTRGELAEQLGVSENTVKTTVRRLLRRAGHGSLEALRAHSLASLPSS